MNRNFTESADSTSQPQATLSIENEMSLQTEEEGQKITAPQNNFNHLVNNDDAGSKQNSPRA